jgi:hypothetical protein
MRSAGYARRKRETFVLQNKEVKIKITIGHWWRDHLPLKKKNNGRQKIKQLVGICVEDQR